jgi:hypothetical protein
MAPADRAFDLSESLHLKIVLIFFTLTHKIPNPFVQSINSFLLYPISYFQSYFSIFL